MINVGTCVKLIDHSYHVDLDSDGALTHLRRPGGYHSEHKLKVVAINCSFPVLWDQKDRPRYQGPDKFRNDTLVYDKTINMYFFTQERFLKEVCPHCGR